MKAVRATGAGAVHLLDVERPMPLAGDVLVRVQAVGSSERKWRWRLNGIVTARLTAA